MSVSEEKINQISVSAEKKLTTRNKYIGYSYYGRTNYLII